MSTSIKILTLFIALLTMSFISGDNLTEKYTTKEFSVKYPDNWSLDKSGKMNTSFILMQKQKDSKSNFRSNINLLKQVLPNENITLEQFQDAALQQLGAQIQNFEKKYSKTKELNTHEAGVMRYTGKQGDIDLEWKQYYLIEGKQLIF